MFNVIKAGEINRSTGGTLKFEGEHYGTTISFFHVNNDPGAGPGLHKHPYGETWLVRAGKGLMTIGDQEFEIGPDDIATIAPETPHKFKNIGTGKFELFCIHDSPTIIQIELET
jgi:mannose-6-phosphate isomerase-like protein (cupin superfamily)